MARPTLRALPATLAAGVALSLGAGIGVAAPVVGSETTFAWDGGLPGATYDWELRAADGSVVNSSPDSVTNTETTVGPFEPGTYSFRVRLAGDLPGAWIVLDPPHVVEGPGVPTPVTTPTPTPPQESTTVVKTARTLVLTRPPVYRANLIRPRKGNKVKSKKPLVKWIDRKKATAYNVQLWELRGKKARKVWSSFPRIKKTRIPASKTKPGRRYIVRVWPYRPGTGFTKRPLAMSYFDRFSLANRGIKSNKFTVNWQSEPDVPSSIEVETVFTS